MRRTWLVLVLAAAVGWAGCSKSARSYFESGNKYFSQQKYKEAVVEYRNAVQKDPQFGDARLKLAESFERLGDMANAYQQYVRAADLLPANLEAQLKAGALLLVARKYEDAKTRAEGILKRDPKNVRAQVLLGNATAGLNDLDGAIAEIEEAIQLDPKESRTYTNLGILQRGKGNLEAAEQAFKQALAINPKSVEAQMALGRFYWDLGRQADAETALKAALALDPKNLVANRTLAAYYVSSNRAAEAEQYLKAAAAITKQLREGIALADFYLGMGRDADARALLDTWAATREGFAPAKTRLAALQYAEGKRQDAHKTIDEVIAREPKNDAALVVKARFQASERHLDEALATAKAATAANPRSLNAHYLVGSIYAVKNDPDAAIAAFNEVLKLNPRAVAAQLQISRLELMPGRGGAQRATQYAEQALTTDPNNPVARLMLVRSLMQQGNTARAESELGALVRQYPNAAPVQASVGTLCLARRDWAGARAAFEKALKADRNSTEALAGMVALDLQAKRPAEARARVEARLARTPDDPSVLILAARTYASSGDPARAEQPLLKAIEASPDTMQAYSLLGQLYIAQRKLGQAREKFEQMAARQPKPVGPHTMVAMILQLEGKQAEAQKRYEKVLEIDSRAPVAANNLAWMYAESGGNLDLALQLAQTAKAGLTDAPEVDDTLGWVYYKKNLAAQALAPLRQAVAKDPQNAAYRYHLGMALARTGDVVGGRGELERALKLSPQFDGAAEARKALASLQ